MSHENLVGLHVTDAQSYQQYREAMMPLLARFGGGFRYDFWVAETLKSEATHPINRVFAIYFKDRQSREAFFADPEYKQIRATYFKPAVQGATIIAEYDR